MNFLTAIRTCPGMPLKVLNIFYNCHDNCLHLICVWEYMNYTFYPNCSIMKYKGGIINRAGKSA